jgi:hypothetical protein
MADRTRLTRRAALGLIGAGGLLSVTQSYARDSVHADRGTNLTTVDDPSAYLGLDGHGDVSTGDPLDSDLTVTNNTASFDLEVTVTTTDFTIGGEGGPTQTSFTLTPGASDDVEFFPENANQDDVQFSADVLDGGTTVGSIDMDRTITVAIQAGQIYRIENVHSGLVMDVNGAGNQAGTNVIQYSWNGGQNQQWEVVSATGGTFRLEPQHANNKALGVENASTAEGASLVQRQWTNGQQGPDRRWDIVLNGDGTYRLENQNSGFVADVADESTSNGGDVIQWDWKGNDAAVSNQKWIFKPV